MHFNIICKIYYNRVFSGHFNIDEKAILGYLDKCETWTKYEFFLANHAFQIFNMDSLHNLTLMALDNKSGSRDIDQFVLDFCFHATMALISNDRDECAKNIINHYYNNKSIKKDLAQLGFNIAMRF